MIGNRASHRGGPFHIVVGVTGGIAAYKTCALVRRLREAGADVTVIPTPAALGMVGRTTWQALTGKPVHAHVDDDAEGVAHVRLGRQADAIVVAPATANTLAKMRAGIADNLLTSTLLAATCPVIVAPAMHTEMWQAAATRDNVAALKARSVHVIEPAVGRLTGSDSGPGRMPEPEDIASFVWRILADPGQAGQPGATRLPGGAGQLAGLTFAISAGGTHEPIDPVRYIGNRSTGRFGVEIARQALAHGADVILVAASVEGDVLARAAGADIRHVETARQLHEAMDEAAERADVVIMTAAVADYRPAHPRETKRKKDGQVSWSLDLVENPDILADLARTRRREGQTVVGFAAETGDEGASAWEYGRDKARRKAADLMVINRVGQGVGFGDVDTSILIVDGRGQPVRQASGSKAELAATIVLSIAQWRSR
ncbi:MAG: bifunctional phosphopantothenoylcysteine decarboxylase/phosphopantothenate--cysteine ligase CoaBC [Actinomycetaceae bacterium]|nr:bifunctional phosphopantothenoylcysteine decarboxylase/phosphopantothenate--cysteine ligase CoaBC [Actinomycetaceae bacterium]